jgi:general secretion pathway protein J
MERIYPATKRDLQLAYPDVEGTDTSLVFIAPADAAHSPDALRRYTLHVSTSGDLVLDSRSDLWRNMTISIVPPPMDEVLLHGVRGITLSYFDGATRGGVWLPSWHQRPYMPALIRLKLAFSVGDRRWWPTFLVHPLATIDTGCVLNRATGSCSGRL